MKILITLTETPAQALATLMADDMQDNKSAYITYLISQEVKRRKEPERRAPGRPRKDEDSDELPDENAPRTMTLPKELAEFVILPRRKDLVNEYDIAMIREKKAMHDN